MKPLGSLNLQGFFVFRIVQFSRYQFVIFIDPLHLAAFLLYHIAYRLSRGFLNFFKIFWAPDSWYRSPLEAAYLAYHISFGLSSTFSKFLFLLSVWVVFPALLATYLFYHTCLPVSTPGCFKSIQYILSIFMHIIQSKRKRTRQTAGCASAYHIVSLKTTPLRASLSAWHIHHTFFVRCCLKTRSSSPGMPPGRWWQPAPAP